MRARDVMNNRVVVALWTIQVVTVLFVWALMVIWMALVLGIPTDDPFLGVMGTFFGVVLLATLASECSFYLRHTLTIELYVLFQIVKASSWAIVLAVLLEVYAGIQDGLVRVLVEAMKKLILPFLASVLYSVVTYFQERASRRQYGPDPVESLFLATQRFEMVSPG